MHPHPPNPAEAIGLDWRPHQKGGLLNTYAYISPYVRGTGWCGIALPLPAHGALVSPGNR